MSGAASAVGATGTYFLVWGGDPMPYAKTLNELNDTTKYKNKIGSHYSYFLVAPTEADNKSWWERSYRRWQADLKIEASKPSSDNFKQEKIDGAFDSAVASTVVNDPATNKKKLNKVCEEVYDKAKADVAVDGTDTNKKNLMNDLFKYCSILGQRPETIKEADQTFEASKIGKTKEETLISTLPVGNDKFWEIKGKWFETLTIDASNYFKQNVGSTDGKKSLKDVCADAYGKDSSSSSGTGPTQADVIKYCSLDTTSTSSTPG